MHALGTKGIMGINTGVQERLLKEELVSFGKNALYNDTSGQRTRY